MVNNSAVQFHAVAVSVLEPGAQFFHALGTEENSVRHRGGTLGLTAGCAHNRSDAQQGTETEVEAQQRQQGDEIPALKHAVEPEHQDHRMRRWVVLCIPGNFAPLRDHGPRDRAGGDQAQQENAEAHGSHIAEHFFHGFIPAFMKNRPPSWADGLDQYGEKAAIRY